MTVDLTDPESIAAWIEVWPERHIGQLRGIYRLQPAFRWQITEAVRLHKERNDEQYAKVPDKGRAEAAAYAAAHSYRDR